MPSTVNIEFSLKKKFKVQGTVYVKFVTLLPQEVVVFSGNKEGNFECVVGSCKGVELPTSESVAGFITALNKSGVFYFDASLRAVLFYSNQELSEERKQHVQNRVKEEGEFDALEVIP